MVVDDICFHKFEASLDEVRAKINDHKYKFEMSRDDIKSIVEHEEELTVVNHDNIQNIIFSYINLIYEKLIN